jgi:uncharacterized protein YcbX
VRVASLHVYPLKGARGIGLDAARVATTGLVHADGAAAVADREWMAVDPDGRFVTQREIPRLALIAPVADARGLVLEAPGAAPLTLLDATSRAAQDTGPAANAAREVVVWRSHVRGHDAGDEAARWISAFLDRDLRLVRFDRTRPRPCNPDYVGDSGAHTLFADGYPVLVIGAASLDDLNERLQASGSPALPMNRFRPNLVVDGLPPYDEDHVDTLRVGDVELTMVKRCIRCQVTTTDQATAGVGIEPLPTLASYRHDERLGGVAFGMNAIVTQGAGSVVRAGAPVGVSYRF